MGEAHQKKKKKKKSKLLKLSCSFLQNITSEDGKLKLFFVSELWLSQNDSLQYKIYTICTEATSAWESSRVQEFKRVQESSRESSRVSRERERVQEFKREREMGSHTATYCPHCPLAYQKLPEILSTSLNESHTGHQVQFLPCFLPSRDKCRFWRTWGEVLGSCSNRKSSISWILDW